MVETKIKQKKKKTNSRLNAIKHGLKIKINEFMPCNLCVNKEKCADFVPGGCCQIDKKTFNELMGEEIDLKKLTEQLINLSIVRLNRSLEQTKYEPHNSEVNKMIMDLKQLIQTLYIIKKQVLI